MAERKVLVVMTTSGRVKEFTAGDTIREVLESVHNDLMRAGSNWDRPNRLFIDGKCIVESGLADVAVEFGQYSSWQFDMVDGLLDEWVSKRLADKQPDSKREAV